jgi:hypothetical protein
LVYLWFVATFSGVYDCACLSAHSTVAWGEVDREQRF